MSVRQNGAVIAGGGTKDMLTLKYISNCIREIPQDIKLELNAGTLTLKAGSKVYVPNGAGVFDVVTIASDITRTGWGSGSDNLMVAYDSNNSNWGGFTLAECFSGSSAPSGSTNMLWYDTTNNKVKQTNNSGSTWNEGWSLPLFIINRSSGTITSIDQVFNGFGYIGSTVFALPGVSGLFCDGRNADGTLKTVPFTISSCVTGSGYNNNNTNYFIYNRDNTIRRSQYNATSFDSINNYIYRADGSYKDGCILGIVTCDSNRITFMNSKESFQALDYNDVDYITTSSFPSNVYKTLTLGSSGTTYTAQSDGWFIVSKTTGTANAYLNIFNTTTGLGYTVTGPGSNNTMRLSCPVSKGQVIQISYNMTGTTEFFRFVYAVGAQ